MKFNGIYRSSQKEIPHKTVEKNIKKKIEKSPLNTDKPIKDGLLFPLVVSAAADYHTGMRRFNSNREKGRKHAGCDLYAMVGTKVRAMADGVIIQCYDFYWKTDAIEVDHGGFIVRYGELEPRVDAERQKLKTLPVKRGDILGKVGQLIRPNGKKFNLSMLHLEIYSTNASPLKTPLSNKIKPPFQRRSDLINPSATLDKCVKSI
jgi:murein DD-endopeptidase MepM/ murein hydrolase activator NlpD